MYTWHRNKSHVETKMTNYKIICNIAGALKSCVIPSANELDAVIVFCDIFDLRIAHLIRRDSVDALIAHVEADITHIINVYVLKFN